VQPLSAEPAQSTPWIAAGRLMLCFGCARLFGRGVSARGPVWLSLEPIPARINI
jgi:hypothetical protein